MTKKKTKTEELGGELSVIPNAKYQQFFDKFAEIETLDVAQWKTAHLVGYFCKKYKQAFDLDYQFKYNDPNPNKCYEVWRISTLAARLSAKPHILKDYIDWVFEEKVSKAKRRFNSISFITGEKEVNYYKMNVLLANKKDLQLDRTTPLPISFKEILATNGFQINTYGDLSFLMQSNCKLPNFNLAIEQLINNGFDLSVMEKVI
jgi:hypothetical protein